MLNFLKIKNNTITKSFWFLLLMIWSSSFAFSFQDYSPTQDYLESEIVERKFDASVWENTTADIDYSNQKDVKPKEKKELTDDTDDDRNYESEEITPPQTMSDFWRGFFKFFLIALAVIVLAFIIGNMVGAEGWALAPSNRKIQPAAASGVPITLENIEENIHESDLERFLREALEKENYPQAVRLYYLAIIKELSLKRWIKWKKDKTNRDYIRELGNTNFHEGFRNVTRMFERVWYGKQNLDGSDFRGSVQPEFKDLLKDTQNANKKV